MISKKKFRLKKDRTPYSDCFCRTPELIENYDKAIADTTQIWSCHHRLETHNSDGERRFVEITREELKALDMYYDRPPEELIFLKENEHTTLHNKGKPSELKGKALSEEHKIKISEANKGKHLSEEHKSKLSESLKRSTFIEEIKVRMSTLHKGKHWKLVDGKRVWY